MDGWLFGTVSSTGDSYLLKLNYVEETHMFNVEPMLAGYPLWTQVSQRISEKGFEGGDINTLAVKATKSSMFLILFKISGVFSSL